MSTKIHQPTVIFEMFAADDPLKGLQKAPTAHTH